MGLEEYKRKRKFEKTPEPAGKLKRKSGNSFVIQKHRARRLHYDFRLEMDGVLRSWAVPKGPSLNPAEKRLAMETEDHPIDYGSFEGIIPLGNYGAGNVIIWDRGTYEMVDPESPEKGWKKGKLHFVLRGEKLKGEWVLVRGSRQPRQWIFFKIRDEYASADTDITESRPESVVSGKLVDEISTGKARSRQWVTGIESEMERHRMKETRSPVPENIRPMLATLIEKPFNDPNWLFELKLDGIRAIAVKNGSKVEMRTRNEKRLSHRFPALAAALLELPVETAVLDGEIVALDERGHSHFSRLQPRIHLSRARDIALADERIPVHFYAFDLLYINGYNIMKFPLIQRKAVLRQLIPDNKGWIRFLDHIEGQGKRFFKAIADHGLEGVVAKLKRSQYQQARTKSWLKVKTQETDHFVIGGFTAPEGSRKYFGAVLLGLYQDDDLIYVGRAGGGFAERTLANVNKELKRLVIKRCPFQEVPAEVKASTWVRPQLVCEVRFSEWTPDRKLRQPVFQGLRDDVHPKQCVLEESIPKPLAGSSDDPLPKTNEPIQKPVFQRMRGRRPDAGRIQFTNLEKLFWPEDGFTKRDLINYYDRISPFLIPHLVDRPLVFKRYPDGIHGQFFYQKDAPDYTPEWIRTQEIWSEDVERSIRYFIGADREQLLYIANTGAITQNPWMSRVQHVEYPDYVIFDLDPVAASFSITQKVAMEIKGILDELELRAYPKTSGASGIHVHLPLLERTFTYRESRIFAEAIASIVVQRLPDLATTERVVERRKAHMVYVDCLQNVKGKTVASVYSPRAQPGAPVSTPLQWKELEKPLNPKAFTIKTIFKRLDTYGDLFEKVLSDRQDISAFLEILSRHGSRKRRK